MEALIKDYVLVVVTSFAPVFAAFLVVFAVALSKAAKTSKPRLWHGEGIVELDARQESPEEWALSGNEHDFGQKDDYISARDDGMIVDGTYQQYLR